MALEWTLLRSKVARRLLAVFVACAVLPIGVLSFVTLDRVSEQLRLQSQKRLHAAAKATALTILGRIQRLDTRLSSLAEISLSADASSLREAAAGLGNGLTALSMGSDSGSLEPLLGPPLASFSLTRQQRDFLATGRGLLHSEPGPDGTQRLLLLRRLGPEGLLAGEIDVETLLDVSDQAALPPFAEICVLAGDRALLGCSLEQAQIPSQLLAGLGPEPSGDLEWELGDESYLARYWSLFLEGNFFAGSWRIVVAEPRAEVLAPIASFRTTFAPAVVVCLCAVSLLSIRLIRSRLEPLSRLREGTRRLSRRDFAVQIDVESGDEFEELASSFNHMAGQLSQQFGSLATMLDIDRAILSALDPPSIAGLVVSRVRELYPCDVVAVLVTLPDRPDVVQIFLSSRATAAVEILESDQLCDDEKRQILVDPDHRLLELDESSPRFVQGVREAGCRLAAVFPMIVRGELAGVIVCGHADAAGHDPERVAFARQLADQAASSLSNAYTLEANRALAYFDSLTGLPNRLLFRERTEQALVLARRHDQEVAVCLLDLDGFKRVNDTLGHGAGDRLLCAVATRLSKVLRDGSLARLGGDEFTILLREAASVDDAARVAQKVVEEFARPFEIDGGEVFVSASIGVAVYPTDADELGVLLRNADTAMYHAKDAGGNTYRFYTPSMYQQVLERLTLESELRRALDRGELCLYYQPVFDAGTREIVAAEALIRWQHPERGIVCPTEFVPLAEETGLIMPIGEWVLGEACRQAREWQTSGLWMQRVNVNLSSRQVHESDVLRSVGRALGDSGLLPQHLTLELTETVLIRADDGVRRMLQQLRDQGVRIALDDFGTGYSSLSYLKQFPLDTLKIDRCFVTDVTRSPEDAAIVNAVLVMARSLGLSVVAEGVETEEQLAFLRERGCRAIQGFLLSKPLPPDGFEKLLVEAAS